MDPNMISSMNWEKVMDSGLLVLFLLLFYFISGSVIHRKVRDAKARYTWKKNVTLLTVGLAFLLLGRIWVSAIQPVVTFLGIIAAALTIAHKEPILSLTGGLFIIWRGLFSIGDRIQVDKYHGDVIGTGVFYFTLFEVAEAASGHQSTGHILKIPNHLVLSSPIINHSKFFPHVWHELSIVLQPHTNWIKAKAILQQVTEKHAEAFEGSARAAIQNAKQKAPIILQKTGPKVYVSVHFNPPAGIHLTSRFLCEARAIRDTEMLIYEDLLVRLKKEGDIVLAIGNADAPAGDQVPS